MIFLALEIIEIGELRLRRWADRLRRLRLSAGRGGFLKNFK